MAQPTPTAAHPAAADNNRQSPAAWHLDTCHVAWRRVTSAHQHGCRCPQVVQEVRRRARERERRRRNGRGTCRLGLSKGYDEVVVERVIGGDRTIATTAPERREVVARLTRTGWSANQLADLLGCTPRTVVRHRKAIRNTVVVSLPTKRRGPVAVGCDGAAEEAA